MRFVVLIGTILLTALLRTDDAPQSKLPLAAERSVLATVETIAKAREAYLEAARKEQVKLAGLLQDESKKETQQGHTQQALFLSNFSQKLKLVTLRRLAEMDQKKRPAVCGEPTMAAAIVTVLNARETYFGAVKDERKKLVVVLEQELKNAQDGGNLERALALRSAIETFGGDTFRDLVEAELAKRPSAAETKEVLLGTWEIELIPKNFKSEWTFFENGTVLSTQGAQRGNWRFDLPHNRILITWGGGRAESLILPLNTELTVGESWHGKDVRVHAKKKDPLVD